MKSSSKIIISMVITILAVLCGCTNDNKTSEDNTVTDSDALINLFEESIDKDYNAQLTEKNVVGRVGSQTCGITFKYGEDDNYKAGGYIFFPGELIETEQETELEYKIENCVGSIGVSHELSTSMPSSPSEYFSLEDMEDNTNDRTFSVSSSEQGDVYLKVYYYQPQDEEFEDNECAKECFRYIRLTVTDKSTDEEHIYTFRYKYSYGAGPDRLEVVAMQKP